MAYETLDAFLDELVSGVQYEHKAKFFQGDVLFKACEPDVIARLGFPSQDALLKWAAQQTGRELRTMWKRLQVSRTFAPDQRNDRVSWEVHWLCTTTDNPLAWLKLAADNEWTTTQLKLKIKANGGDPDVGETEFVCRAADATVLMVSDNGRHVVLDIAGGVEVAQGTAVVVTIAIVHVSAEASPADLVTEIVRGDIGSRREVA